MRLVDLGYKYLDVKRFKLEYKYFEGSGFGVEGLINRISECLNF